MVELCPICRKPVHFVPDLQMVIGGPDNSYMSCGEHQFPVDFDGFIRVPVERPDPLFDRYEEALGEEEDWRDSE